jgi:hypothetical protein
MKSVILICIYFVLLFVCYKSAQYKKDDYE